MTDVSRSCIDCATGGCKKPGQMHQPDFCPSATLSPDEREDLAAAYTDLDLQLIQAANEVSARCGHEGLCRLEEIMDFARRLGYRKIGIANCGAMQTERLNAVGTELNVIMGPCVGHDSIFMRHYAAPCTTFVVKDRMLGNNPIAVLHTCNVAAHRWSRLKKENDSLSPL